MPRFLVDLHTHSHYSRATSPRLTPDHLEYWARVKGLGIVGTGDCVHPGWMRELEAKLEPAGDGLFRLKDERRLPESRSATGATADPARDPRFVLTTEIATIYKKGGKVRKLHHVCVFPDFATARKVQARLERIGNIRSDGRPILGMDPKDLLAIVLESSPRSCLIPAHIWTPWFAVLGSMSGFDTIEECFEDLTGEIFAVETGLSSDPPMNRSCSFLDRFRLVSNSDAHSPERLGRESNILETDLDYGAVFRALKMGEGFRGTVEFYPEEGKYHFDGHRKCGVRWSPSETRAHDAVCPACGRPVTLGVMHRVAALADRDLGGTRPRSGKAARGGARHHSTTGLPELLGEILGKGSKTKAAMRAYFEIVRTPGPEYDVLLFRPEEEIKARCGEILAEGIRRLRAGEVLVEAGYDGEYGRVTVFREGERNGFGSGLRAGS
jgi:DNA helicase-2/ATP-dependent DNA helicase PcrA